jgi:O-antigen ligase
MNDGAFHYDSDQQHRHAASVWWIGYLLVVVTGLMVTALARRRIYEPFLGLSLAIILVLLLGWLIHPRATLYTTLFLTAISDQITVWWFPFAKNLSSRESIAYVADSLTFTPLQLSLFFGCAISMLRRFADRRTLVARTPMNWPLLVFTAFVVYGFIRGLSSGGNVRAAIFEGRPLFNIALVFVIVVNECTEARHLRYALWALLSGVVAQSLLSIDYLNRLGDAERDALERLTEHGSVVAQSLLIVTFLAILLFRVRGGVRRWALFLGLLPTVYVFLVGQRRAGIAALAVGAVILAVAVLWRRPKVFWSVVPVATLVIAAYTAAFWSSQSVIGFPAQAIKGFIAPDQASAEDRSSDIYRWIEAYNLNYTIRADPLKGLGFGRPFYRPVPLPDISVFEFNAYQPHNTILWIWIKMGFIGFAATFYMLGRSIVLGAERVRRMPQDVDLVVTLAATLYIAMYTIYSFVDISWDLRNTAFLGFAIAVCAVALADRDPDTTPGADSSSQTTERPSGAGRRIDAITATAPSA